jgi:hypothetical protein
VDKGIGVAFQLFAAVIALFIGSAEFATAILPAVFDACVVDVSFLVFELCAYGVFTICMFAAV